MIQNSGLEWIKLLSNFNNGKVCDMLKKFIGENVESYISSIEDGIEYYYNKPDTEPLDEGSDMEPDVDLECQEKW